MLACYIYPIPGGTEYTEEDLKDSNKVIELFGYCGIWEGLITKKGWQVLIHWYDYEKLWKMGQEALWCDCESIEDYLDWLVYEIEVSLEDEAVSI